MKIDINSVKHLWIMRKEESLVAKYNMACKGKPKNKLSQDSLSCSPPRKSLVKGERFMRFEGKPEHMSTLNRKY